MVAVDITTIWEFIIGILTASGITASVVYKRVTKDIHDIREIFDIADDAIQTGSLTAEDAAKLINDVIDILEIPAKPKIKLVPRV